MFVSIMGNTSGRLFPVRLNVIGRWAGSHVGDIKINKIKSVTIINSIGFQKGLIPFSSFRAIPVCINHEYSFLELQKRERTILFSKVDEIFVHMYGS